MARKAPKRGKAMKEVKVLVRKHGRLEVQYCLNQLKDYEKKTLKLAAMKKETEKLEKEIENN